MKTLHLLIIVISVIASVVTNSINLVFAEVTTGPPPPWPITIVTDKSIYVGNETITISGKVNEGTGKIVHIQILDSNYVAIRNYTTPESENGNYILKIKGNLGDSGHYDIQSYVIEGLFDSRPIQYISGPYKLIIGEKVWPINYMLNDGILGSINADVEKKSLTLHIVKAINGAQLGIDLPRKLIDAKFGNYDGNFVVLMRPGKADFRQENYTETETNPDLRNLVINATMDPNWGNPTGEWDIKIIGTNIVPEFPFTMPILVISIASLIAFYRIRINK
jgi:hypothetical protein